MKKNFITSCLSENMYANMVTRNGGISIIVKPVAVETLKGKSLISSLKNQGLVGTLNEYGVEVEVNPINFSIEDEETTLYVVSAERYGKKLNIRDYINDECLPVDAALEVMEYTFHPLSK